MKKVVIAIIGILLFADFLLPDSKDSLSPFFTIENTVITQEREWELKKLRGVNAEIWPVNLIALGLEFQRKDFFTSVSLSAPWWKERSQVLQFFPGVDITGGFNLNKFFIQAGIFASFRQKHVYDVYGPASPVIYSGIGFRQRIKDFFLECGFLISKGKYSLYDEHEYFQTYALQAKAGYDPRGLIHPFVTFSLEKLSLCRDLTFNVGFGVTFGSRAPHFRTPAKMAAPIFYLVEKPNIYLYPIKPCQVEVVVKPQGRMTVSIPSYGEGWNVMAYPDGAIENTPGYLFYEALVPVEPSGEGWCLSANEVTSFFEDILKKYGFQSKEIKDFLEYWPKKLSESVYYAVYPVINGEVDKVCPLRIKPKPDNILRVWFVFKPLAEALSLKEPKIPVFNRKGFVAVEWGGIVFVSNTK